jgi:hypothetical protein
LEGVGCFFTAGGVTELYIYVSRWEPLITELYLCLSFWEPIVIFLHLVYFLRLALGDKYILLFICHILDCLCGLVVSVLGYRSGGPGSIPEKKSSGSGTGSTQPREYN